MRNEILRLPAYAKINLSLEVLGKRDDGYHDVATILQTVDLADELTISPSPQLDVLCDDPELSGEQNIVWDAAVAVATYAGIEPKARIGIEKRIPTAAGVGGGSADAAAAVRALNRFWRLGLARQELHSLASGLGSDVPFLVDGGTAFATGRGDVVVRLASEEGLPVLLITPAHSIPRKTPTLYGALTPQDYSDGTHTRQMAESAAFSRGTITSESYQNAFARVALEIFPGLSDVWEKTAAITQYTPCLSGAGPAFFCIPTSETEYKQVADALRDTGAKAYLVRTINPVQDV